MHAPYVLRIRTVSNADGLYGVYDPSTALTLHNSAEVLGMAELSLRSQTKRHGEIWTLGEGYVSEWESVPSGVPPGNQIRALSFFDYH